MGTTGTKGTALITGASSGIGKTYAERLAGRGYNLIVVARNVERLEGLASRLREEAGVEVEVVQADLSEKADLLRVEEKLKSDESITMLVNNAGIATPVEIVGADLDLIETMVKLNITAVTRLAGVAATAFVSRGHGTIINIGSIVALMAEAFSGTYSGSKAYVLNFTQALNKELGDKGIRVQAVLPGITRTEIWERSGHDVEALPAHMVMGVEDMVDAALAGLDLGELVTIPSLPDIAEYEKFEAVRHQLRPNLSLAHPAARYQLK